MNFLHTNNPPVLHRVLKSLNILLTEKIEKSSDTTNIKISVFGVSRLYEKLNGFMTGHVGTCHWMAPEIIENKNYNTKIDVYSYGIILWEMCTRKTPYDNMTPEQIQFYVTAKKVRPDMKKVPLNSPQKLFS